MPIISVSLDEESLLKLGSLQRELGFSGRSDFVRAAINSLSGESRSLENLSGKLKAVLLLVHSENSEGASRDLAHEFEDLAGTQVHTNLKGEKCLEIFVLEGEADRIREMLKKAKAGRKMEHVKLIVP